MRIALGLGLAAVALALAAGVAAGATPLRVVEAGGATFPDRSYILTLPVRRALTNSQLRVTENGVPVQGLRLAGQGAGGQSRSAVVLAIDASESMSGKPIQDALAAARAFAARRNPQQELAIVTFNGSVDVLQSFTTDSSTISSALRKTPTLGLGTKIYDGLDKSLALISSANAAPASIILLSDGTDVGSSAKPADVLSRLKSAHVRVFSVGLASKTFDVAALMRLASSSRGSFVRADSPSLLKPIFAALGQRLSSEYVLTYRSRTNPGTQVSVRVAVRGISGVASTAYKSSPLRLVPAPPYKSSRIDRVIQSPIVMLVVAFVIAGLLALALLNIVKDRSDPLVHRVSGFVSVRPVAQPATQSKEATVASTNFLRRRKDLIRRAVWTERLAETLELADIALTPAQVVLLTACGTLLAILVLDLILGPLGILFAVVVTPYLARVLILNKLTRKRRAFAEQLPDNLDVLASALRTGHSLVGALTVVANDATEPSKSELNRVLADEQFGAQLEDALKVTVTRMQNPDLDQVALVARLQREMGSNAAEVLDRIVETVRARMELRRLVRTLTAQGRLSRWILTGLPIGIGLLLAVINHGYMKPLFDTTLGKVLLALAVAMVAAGSFVIGKLIDIKA